MKRSEVCRAWGRILTGRYPSLSIEIARECPLRCPGCYAYEPEHLGREVGPLRTLADYKGDQLAEGVLRFGGTPDCAQCGCIASAGLKAVGDYRLLGFVPLRALCNASDAVGKTTGRLFNGNSAPPN